MVEADDHDEPAADGHSEWNTDPTIDYPVGPDDAGNAVMYGIGAIGAGWRWLIGKLTPQR